MRGKSFIRMRIEPASANIPLNGGVELFRVESFKPRAKPRQFARGELLDGLFYVFGGGHVLDIASVRSGARTTNCESWQGSNTMYTLVGIGLLVAVALLSNKDQRKGAWLLVAAVVVLAVIFHYVR